MTWAQCVCAPAEWVGCPVRSKNCSVGCTQRLPAARASSAGLVQAADRSHVFADARVLCSPDGLKKAYVRLAEDYDALDVANKIGII